MDTVVDPLSPLSFSLNICLALQCQCDPAIKRHLMSSTLANKDALREVLRVRQITESL